MLDQRTQVISVRVTLQEKNELQERAREEGLALSELILMFVGNYDGLTRQVADLTQERDTLTRQLKALSAEREDHKTALQRAEDVARQFTAKQVEAARREAVAEYRQSLRTSLSTTGNSDGIDDDPDPETFAELRTRLAQYETPALLSLSEQLRGHESDVLANGEPRTIYVDDVPDVVQVMVYSFTPQFDLDDE